MEEVKINISPFELQSIIKISGVQNFNEHSYVDVSGYIDADKEDKYVKLISSEELWGNLECEDESGKSKIFFTGIVTRFRITVKNGVKVLSFRLTSGTYLMDLVPHIRTFQKEDYSYKSILELIMKNYSQGRCIFAKGGEEKPNKLVAQYEETDWVFSKRIASRLHAALIPDVTVTGSKFYVGSTSKSAQESIVTNEYQYRKDIKEFLYKSKNGLDEIKESDIGTYTISLRTIYKLGSKLNLNGETLIIYRIESEYVGNELIHTYYLRKEKGVQEVASYNFKMVGVSLNGKITGVERDTVKVSLSEDENAAKSGERWFPFSTVYSSPDGTGWYCMPENGDDVRLYIPNEKEENAYVISAVHAPSGDSESRSDPNNKSLKNKQGKEVVLRPDSVEMTNNNGMSIKISDSEGIIIDSDKEVKIKSKQDISMTSMEGGLTLSSPKKITLKQAGTTMNLEDAIKLSGGRVNME